MVEKERPGNPSAKKKQGDKNSRQRFRQGASKRDTFPWINSQIITVSESGNLMELATTIEAYVSQMNLVNISTAFHRIARLWTTNEDQEAAMTVKGVVQALIHQANTVLARASASGTKPSAQALANITWAMVTLNAMDENLLQAIATPAQGQVRNFKPFELSTILWSYAKLSTLNPDACSCARPLFEAAASCVPGLLEEFTLRCLVTIVWSYATFRQKEEALFQSIGDHLISQVHTANCGELANTAWAYGLLQIQHERLFQELARRATVRLQDFKQQEVAGIMWGFAANNFFQAAFFNNASLAAQRLVLTPQQLTNILWALTRRKCRQSSLQSAVMALLPAATRQLDRFSMPEIAICSLAAAKVAKNMEGSGKGGGPKISNAVDFCTAAMQQALSRLSELSNQLLVNLAAAFLLVGAPGAVVVLAAVGREALDRMQMLENTVLLHLIRVFSIDLAKLQPPALLEGACQGMFRALFAEAARRMDSLKPREMQSLSLLCAQPLGLTDAGDMSAGDLRSCCFALATTGNGAHQPLSLLDELVEDDHEVFWDPDPVEVPKQTPSAASNAPAAAAFPTGVAVGVFAPPAGPMGAWPAGHEPPRPEMGAAFPGWFAPGQQPGMVRPFPCGYPSQDAPSGSPAPQTQGAPLAPGQAGQQASRPSGDLQAAETATRGENKVMYSVKNTFLHIDEPEEQEEDPQLGASGPWASEEGLGEPLPFLPKDIELTELQAFRADYMKFRAGQATGARGEIQDVPEVPLASESTIGALDLQQSGQYPVPFAGQPMPEG
mmetsp:Transcript_136069/g.322487  ORF Transcript_136069/g.322487 Transcript_136069/m.322487 type:complete len:783 (+) Transcript_136069:89-2437(+)